MHGVAAGAGLALLLQADFVLAAEDTRLNLAYIKLGTNCDVGASWALPRLVGLRRALEIALLGDTYPPRGRTPGPHQPRCPPPSWTPPCSNWPSAWPPGPPWFYGHYAPPAARSSFDNDLPTQLHAEAAAFAQCGHGRPA